MKTDSPVAPCGQALTLTIPAIILALTGAAITVFDAILMAEGAAAMAPGSHGGSLLAGVAICAAIFKAGWLSAFRECLLRRSIALAVAVLAFGLLTHLFSMAATIGIAATGRDAVVSSRSDDQARHKRTLAAYEDARAHKAAMPGSRPAAQIRTDLAGIDAELAEQAGRETAERKSACGGRCAEAIRKGDAAKAARAALKAELAIALDAAQAGADLASAQAALDAIKAPQTKDPQAATLAAYVPAGGFTEREAAMLLPILPTLIVEIGAPVCFLVAGAFLAFARQRRRPAPVTALVRVAEELAAPVLPAASSAQKRLAAPQSAASGKATARPVMSAAEMSAVRAALGESQEAFAGRFAVNVRTIRRWENGEGAVSRKAALTARTIAAGLRKPALRAVAYPRNSSSAFHA